MELAKAALSSLLPKLGSLLTNEYNLQKGLRGEISSLQLEMEIMEAALDRVSRQPAQQIDYLVMIWVRDLKELAYDIEDSIDEFMLRVDAPVRAEPHSFRWFLERAFGLLKKVKARHQIAANIEDIKRRVHEVSDRRKRYKFDDTALQPDTTAIDSRLPALYADAAKLVGTDGPAEKVTNLLMGGKGARKLKLMVVSIVGVGGLGKTTIANLVYERLEDQFDCQAFVSVSLKPNMKQILSSILRQVSKDTCTNAGEKDPEELIRSIRQFIRRKRYFIVIDDLWSEEAWKIIKCALIDMNLGSRVILTTRNVDVAKFSSVDDAIYELDPLSYQDSKRLFRKRILNANEEICSELEEVTEKILKKCGGVPLAIVTIASLLAKKTTYEWYGILKSMGSGLEKDKTLENMREILYLSYGDLPSYLKPCMLYLSMFPEDYKLSRYNLVDLWVAEGFVDEKQASNLYDLGERYFNELVNRSMIQPVKMDQFGNVELCRVHDMILDLIISLSEKENFVTISGGSELISPVCRIRRLSLQGSKVYRNDEESKGAQMILPTTVNISHVRTLVASGHTFQWMPSLSRFSVLRVLSLTHLPSKNNRAKDLGCLHHLRYLKLGGKLETELLEEIGNLQLLKKLDLRDASIQELPATIVQLKQLEHLIVSSGVKFPDGIGNLMSLQELAWLDVEESPNTLAELSNLIKLRVLCIHGLHVRNESYVETFLRGLSNLRNLQVLNFRGNRICSLDWLPDQWRVPGHLQKINGRNTTFYQVPQWFSSLSELSCLSISVKLIRQEDLELLGALPVLRFLNLQVDHDSTEERLMVGVDQPFRSLAEFKFKHYTRCWLVFSQGVMPKLQRLELFFEAQKRQGGGFDVGLENLSSLKHVTIEVNCCAMRIKDVEDVESTIRDAIDMHPNHPTLEMSRKYKHKMSSLALILSLFPTTLPVSLA